ncbi:MAG: YIP1 family protein [Haloarculaceae archaeon]
MPPRTPLLRPDRYFAERESNFFRVMAVVGLLVAAGPAVVSGVGWVLAAHLDGTVLVDNPERPPDRVCDDDTGDSSVFDGENCDAPREVERDVGAILWDAIDEIVGPAFLAYPLALVVLTLLLHAGAWLAGADHGFFPTFAVAAWGMVPTLLLIPVSLGLLSVMLDPVTVSPGDDPRTAIRPLLAQIRALEPYSAVLSAATAVWGGVIWRFGRVYEQGLPGTEATVVAGLVALLTAAAGLL